MSNPNVTKEYLTVKNAIAELIASNQNKSEEELEAVVQDAFTDAFLQERFDTNNN